MTPEQYEAQASQCRLLAEGTADLTVKRVLLDMARAWLQMKEQNKKSQGDDGGAAHQARPKRSRRPSTPK